MSAYIPDWAKPYTSVPKTLKNWNFIKQNIYISCVSDIYIDTIKQIIASDSAMICENIETPSLLDSMSDEYHLTEHILLNDIHRVMWFIQNKAPSYIPMLKIFCNMYYFESEYGINIKSIPVSYDLINNVMAKTKISLHMEKNISMLYFEDKQEYILFKLLL